MITRVVPVVALSLVLMGPALAGGPTSKESAATKIPGTSWRRGSSPQLDDKLDELRKLRRERRKKGAKVEELDKSIQRLVAEIVPELLRDLKSGAQDVRDRAAAQLAEVGAAAVPELEKLAASDDAEAKARAQSVLKLIREVEADDQGLWKQWAHSAKASSEFDGQGEQDEEDWNAIQACGKPDTEEDGDQATAWASMDPDGGEEWLELTYKHEVRPARVRVHETFNPGAVVKIEGQDAEKKWHVLWKGKDTNEESPGYLDVSFDPPAFATRVIRVTLDTESVEGWNEIDAVQLIGEPAGLSAPPEKKPDSSGSSGKKEDEPVAKDESDSEPAPKAVQKSIKYESKHIGATRRVQVWLPPGHDPKKTYPVFYTSDGMLNVRTKLVERLIADGRIPPVIIVAINHGPNMRMKEYVPQVSPEDFLKHEKWFVEEVLPWAEKEFGASANRMERIVFGSSNGGPWSLTMGARHPDLFGNVVGAMVYALKLPKWKKELAETPNEKQPQRFFLYAGSKDANGVRENKGVEKVLKARGYQVSNTVIKGEGHTNRLNQNMLPKVLEKFFGKKKEGEKETEKDDESGKEED